MPAVAKDKRFGQWAGEALDVLAFIVDPDNLGSLKQNELRRLFGLRQLMNRKRCHK